MLKTVTDESPWQDTPVSEESSSRCRNENGTNISGQFIRDAKCGEGVQESRCTIRRSYNNWPVRVSVNHNQIIHIFVMEEHTLKGFPGDVSGVGGEIGGDGAMLHSFCRASVIPGLKIDTSVRKSWGLLLDVLHAMQRALLVRGTIVSWHGSYKVQHHQLCTEHDETGSTPVKVQEIHGGILVYQMLSDPAAGKCHHWLWQCVHSPML